MPSVGELGIFEALADPRASIDALAAHRAAANARLKQGGPGMRLTQKHLVYTGVFALAVVILIMTLRPTGLIAEKSSERV